MLVRIAQNLYWTGRYIMRSAHQAKFLREQYFSMLDASMVYNRDFVLRSLLNMSGGTEDHELIQDEQTVLLRIAFDLNNPLSIFSSISYARENARGIRHAISSELWQSINKWYQFTKSYDQDYFKQQGLFDFTTQTEEHVKIIESNISHSLLRNDEYQFLTLGMYLESINQILIILKTKLHDTEILSDNGINIPLMHYQWTITLKALDSFDMHNRYYNHKTSINSVAEFLIGNSYLPRSLYFNIRMLNQVINNISIRPEGLDELLYDIAKMESHCRFFEYQNIDHLHDFLNKILNKAYEIHDICANLYFNENRVTA